MHVRIVTSFAIVSLVFALGMARLSVAQTISQSAAQDRVSTSRIAFIQATVNGSAQDVYTMKPDGTDIRQLTHLSADSYAYWESWSPDGRELVFTKFPNGGPGQLWLMNADGSHQRLLHSQAGYYQDGPSFSPDSAWVAFSRCKLASNGDGCAIYKIRTDGSELTAVTHFQLEVSDRSPVYSPDGRTISFVSFSRGGLLGAVYLMNADGSNIRALTPPYLGALREQWSPNGEWIAFTTRCCNPQNNEVWVINADGKDLHRLTGNAESDRDIPATHSSANPSWSPHGAVIVFEHFEANGSGGLFLVNADGSGLTKLLTARNLMRAPVRLQWAKSPSSARQIEKDGFFPRWSPELP